MPTTHDVERAEAEQNRYHFMQERRKRIVSVFFWLLFLCLMIVGLLYFLPKL